MSKKRRSSTISIFTVFSASAIVSLAILFNSDHVDEVTGIIGVLGFVIALVFGGWFLGRLPSVFKGLSAVPPSSRAILLASVAFLVCIVFALPKVYRIQTRAYSRSSTVPKETRVLVKPIWHTLQVANAQVSFVGLSYSIMLCEVAGSVAFGLIIWALGRGKTREKQNKPDAGDS